MKAVLLILACATFAAQDPVDELIDEVVKSASTDAARASALYEASGVVEEKAVKISFLSKAFDFGLKGGAKGFEIAEKAINAIIALLPDQAAAWEEKRLALYRRWPMEKGAAREARAQKLVDMLLASARRHEQANEWKQASARYQEAAMTASRFRLASADAIKIRMRFAGHMNNVWTKIGTLKKSAAANPSARQSLVLALVTEADAPAEAAKHLGEGVDEAMREHVPLAAKPVDQAEAADCLKLARWYSGGLGTMQDPYARYFTRRRAKQYAERFLSLHEAKDINALKARTIIIQADKDLEKLSKQLGLSHAGNVPRKGLILYYTFDRDTGIKVPDKSGKGNHGKVSGAKWTDKARGPGNGAYVLDGEDDLIYLPPNLLGRTNTFTYSVWVNLPPYKGSSWPVFIGGYTTGAPRNISLGLHVNSGYLRMEVDTGAGNFAVKGNLQLPWNKWFHALLVYDGATMTEYLNGVRGLSSRASGNLNAAAMLSIGSDHSTWDSLRGAIDDVMIYGRPLTQKEVMQIYKAQGGK